MGTDRNRGGACRAVWVPDPTPFGVDRKSESVLERLKSVQVQLIMANNYTRPSMSHFWEKIKRPMISIPIDLDRGINDTSSSFLKIFKIQKCHLKEHKISIKYKSLESRGTIE